MALDNLFPFKIGKNGQITHRTTNKFAQAPKT